MHFQAIVIFLSVFCTCEVSGLTASERSIGASIVSKLRSLSNGRYLDTMLIFDSSASVGSSEFYDAKDASKNLVYMVNVLGRISLRGSRVGLIEFSEPRKTGVRFRFGRYNSLSSVTRAIGRIRYDRGGRTATALALRLSISEFRRTSSRNRKLVWMYTDGRSNTGGSPISAAAQLKRMGVTVCVSGIGSNVNQAEINAIASPGCARRFSSFSSYRRVMQHAVSRLRGVSRPRTPSRSRTRSTGGGGGSGGGRPSPSRGLRRHLF